MADRLTRSSAVARGLSNVPLMRCLPILLAALAGCATPAPADERIAPIANSTWTIASIDGMPVGQAADEARYRISFGADRVSGRAGCNSFSGPYSRIGDRLEFGPLAATRMACPEPSMEHERRAFAILGGGVELRSDAAGSLVLSGPGGRLELRRSSDDTTP